MTDRPVTDFEPGIYPDIPEQDYHSGAFGPAGSLSSTEARLILDCPARLRHRREHPQEPKAAFDLGHVVHSMVLGTGLPVYVHDWPDLRSRAAREDVAAHRAAGEVPIRRADYAQMQATADAVLTHPTAGPFFEEGAPEQSLYAVDPATGVWMRGRADWIGPDVVGQRMVDLKTARCADPAQFSRSVADYGYDLQRSWYVEIFRLVTGDRLPFTHVLVEKEPPHLVSVCVLDADFEDLGQVKLRQALDTYAACLESGQWPGYPTTPQWVGPPAWELARLDAEREAI